MLIIKQKVIFSMLSVRFILLQKSFMWAFTTTTSNYVEAQNIIPISLILCHRIPVLFLVEIVNCVILLNLQNPHLPKRNFIKNVLSIRILDH